MLYVMSQRGEVILEVKHENRLLNTCWIILRIYQSTNSFVVEEEGLQN